MSNRKLIILKLIGDIMIKNKNYYTLEQIQEKLKDRRLMYVAHETGLTFMTLSRLTKGIGQPRISTLEILTKYFKEHK